MEFQTKGTWDSCFQKPPERATRWCPFSLALLSWGLQFLEVTLDFIHSSAVNSLWDSSKTLTCWMTSWFPSPLWESSIHVNRKSIGHTASHSQFSDCTFSRHCFIWNIKRDWDNNIINQVMSPRRLLTGKYFEKFTDGKWKAPHVCWFSAQFFFQR